MRKEHTLSSQFAIIGLDGQPALQYCAAKAAVVRGIAAAAFLDKILFWQKEAWAGETFSAELTTALERVRKLKKKEAQRLEKDMVAGLVADGAMEIIPDLLGCDMDYVTAGVEIKAYRSDAGLYLSVTEGLRGEILDDGPVTIECVCLLWLIRESGCIHEIFSVREQEQIQEKITTMTASAGRFDGDPVSMASAAYAEMADIIWKQEFHKGLELMVTSFLKGKRSLFRNPYLAGINLLFPFLERRAAIFVDFVVLGTDVAGRRGAMEEKKKKKGHYVEEVKSGSETLLRIDNMYYRIWPKTVVVNRIPIQGASLLPVYR